MKSSLTLACFAIAGLQSAALATVTFNDTLSIPFTPGTGNSNTHFAISRVGESSGPFAGNNVELALKAKERFFGDTLPISGNVYTAQPGYSPTSGAVGAPAATNRAWWNFDFSIDLGTRTVDNTIVVLTITDPQSDSYSLSLVPPTVPSGTRLIQNSWNIGFAFIAAPIGFDPFLPGDYLIGFTAVDAANNDNLGAVGIVVRVVPAPAAVGVLGVVGLVTLRRRR